jgi:hypothetical protein
MSRPPIEIDVRLTLRDHLRASYWLLFRNYTPLLLILLILAALYPLPFWLGALQRGANESYWPVLIAWIILLLLLTGPYFSARKHLTTNRLLNESHHLTFADDGIHSASASSSGHVGWGNISEVAETKSDFLLFVAYNQPVVIPKRCFQDGEQIDRFRMLLQERVT